MTHSATVRAARALLLFSMLALGSATAPAQGPDTGSVPASSSAASTGVMTLDLTSGKIDTTPLAQTDPLTNEAFDPQTPPQTVEGTLVSIDLDNHVFVVATKRYGEVKVGLPPDVVVTRKGEDSSATEMKPGDRVWATVETAHGVRALRIVFAPPSSPLVSWIGIPVLLLIAFGIWWTGRKSAVSEERAATAQT